MARTPKPAATANYTCVESFALDIDGSPVIIREGQVLTGSDVAVQRHLKQFVPGGIHPDEIAAYKREMLADREPAPAA